jgi:hypothetical protein
MGKTRTGNINTNCEIEQPLINHISEPESSRSQNVSRNTAEFPKVTLSYCIIWRHDFKCMSRFEKTWEFLARIHTRYYDNVSPYEENRGTFVLM